MIRLDGGTVDDFGSSYYPPRQASSRFLAERNEGQQPKLK